MAIIRRSAQLPGIPLRMAAVAALAFSLLLPAACARRVPVYSPRMDNTADHRSASKPADCLECHAVAELSTHSPGDSCLECHKIRSGRSSR